MRDTIRELESDEPENLDSIRVLKIDELENVAGGSHSITWGAVVGPHH
jgi:hypothetical protein